MTNNDLRFKNRILFDIYVIHKVFSYNVPLKITMPLFCLSHLCFCFSPVCQFIFVRSIYSDLILSIPQKSIQIKNQLNALSIVGTP